MYVYYQRLIIEKSKRWKEMTETNKKDDKMVQKNDNDASETKLPWLAILSGGESV